MQETNWKPTEEELIALGFVSFAPYHKCLTLELPETSVGYQFGFDYFFLYQGYKEINVYPKSLEELRLLISMMRP